MCTSCISWHCLQGQAAHGPQDHSPAVKLAMFLGFLIPTCNTEHYSHSPLLSVSNIFMYFWRMTFKYYKNLHCFIPAQKIKYLSVTHTFQVAKCGRKYKIIANYWLSFHWLNNLNVKCRKLIFSNSTIYYIKNTTIIHNYWWNVGFIKSEKITQLQKNAS
jgi:hypothetical protein